MELSNKKVLAWVAGTCVCLYGVAQPSDTFLSFYAGLGLGALGIQLGMTLKEREVEANMLKHAYAEANRRTKEQHD